jgi:hypothetical protein
MQPPVTDESDFRLREDRFPTARKSEEPLQPPKLIALALPPKKYAAQSLHFTNGHQATLLATVPTANPMGCVARCDIYCTSVEMLTLQFFVKC